MDTICEYSCSVFQFIKVIHICSLPFQSNVICVTSITKDWEVILAHYCAVRYNNPSSGEFGFLASCFLFVDVCKTFSSHRDCYLACLIISCIVCSFEFSYFIFFCLLPCNNSISCVVCTSICLVVVEVESHISLVYKTFGNFICKVIFCKICCFAGNLRQVGYQDVINLVTFGNCCCVMIFCLIVICSIIMLSYQLVKVRNVCLVFRIYSYIIEPSFTFSVCHRQGYEERVYSCVNVCWNFCFN